MKAQALPRFERPLKGWHIALGLVTMSVLLVAVVVVVSIVTGPPVLGGVQLSTGRGEPDVDFYVGDRLVGSGRGEMFVTWDEILGWNGQVPLAIVLPNTAPPVSREPDAVESLSRADAERLSGPGASVISVQAGSPIWSGLGESEFARKEILLRRVDGSLDQVFCLDARLVGRLGRTYRVLVPIRVRLRAPSSTGYFTSDSSCGSYSAISNRVVAVGEFESTDPPEELAAEIQERGLWQPGE
jgi:hypothetical protein